MTQRLRGLENIRRAMERRVEEREDVMRTELERLKDGRQGEVSAGEQGLSPR
ncbi:MAG: hypothetical protein IJ702_07050 [Fretibacterium sp.]|nr:hypothetical protein [Fretibacterium sp.]